MFCSKCGNEIPAGGSACATCGPAPQTKPKSGCMIAMIVIGISLAGLLVVAAIIAAIAVPNFLNAVDRGKQKRTTADGNAIVAVIERHAERTGSYPSAGSIEELEAATREDGRAPLATHDGWGHAFQLESSPRGFELISFGKDGEADAMELDLDESFDADLIWTAEAHLPVEATEPDAAGDRE